MDSESDSHEIFRQFYGALSTGYSSTPERRQMAARYVQRLLHDPVMEKTNPLFVPWREGDITMFEKSEQVRKEAYGGIKKYLPRKPNAKNAADMNNLHDFVPNAGHYFISPAGIFMPDNPVTVAAYSLPAAPIVALASQLSVLESFALTVGIGALAGLCGGFEWRNRRPFFVSKKDLAHPRVWHSTQFIDMVAEMARRGDNALMNLGTQAYRPEYPTLDESERKIAYRNLGNNHFIKRFGIATDSLRAK